MHRHTLFCIAFIAFTVFSACSNAQAKNNPPLYTLTIAGHGANVELARTPKERSEGLMFRTSLEENSGMLFVFSEEDVYSFWMRNTYIPLAIAFIDKTGVIVNIEEMQAHNESPVFSKGKILYALEMNTGWFSARGIAPGAQVLFSEALRERIKK